MLTGPQTTAFLEDQAQMGLQARTRAFLATEGIAGPDDLTDFTTDDAWKQVIENCKRPPQIPDPANPGQMINDAPYRIGAKSLMRLKVAAVAVEYYEVTDRPLTAASLMWSDRLKNFKVQWEALMDLKKSSTIELPKITKNVSVVRFLESYETYADQKIGVQNAPLSNVIRASVAVGAATALAPNQPHSIVHGSIREELKQRVAHGTALYKDDNAAVYDDLESATRGTKYAASIAPFKRRRDGRGAFFALTAQFAGPAMWDKEARTSAEFLMSREWTGGTSLTLERFLGQHRAAYVALERCSQHVQCQLPDQRTRVGYLIENIKCNAAEVQAAVAAIRGDDIAGPPLAGKRNNFEEAVAYLLPTDPVEKKSRKSKRGAAEISSTTAGSTPLKSGVGKTGVALRYHSPKDYAKLTTEQRDELREHRRKNGKGNAASASAKGNEADKFTRSPKKLRSHISAVLKQMEEEKEAKQANLAEIRALLSSVVKSESSSKKASISSAMAAAGTPDSVAAAAAAQGEEAAAEVAAVKLTSLMKKMQLGATKGKKSGGR